MFSGDNPPGAWTAFPWLPSHLLENNRHHKYFALSYWTRWYKKKTFGQRVLNASYTLFETSLAAGASLILMKNMLKHQCQVYAIVDICQAWHRGPITYLCCPYHSFKKPWMDEKHWNHANQRINFFLFHSEKLKPNGMWIDYELLERIYQPN